MTYVLTIKHNEEVTGIKIPDQGKIAKMAT